MAVSLEEFFHGFRQEVLADGEANSDFLEAEFTARVASELGDAGITEGFEACHYRPAAGGMRVDGYWFGDSSLDLFITDFANRETVQSLTQSDVTAIFRRVENFFTACIEKNLYLSLEETSQGYGLARLIADRRADIVKISCFLLSERSLSEQARVVEDRMYQGVPLSFHVWDISRLHRLATSRGAREELAISFADMPDGGLPCLPAHLPSTVYKSYLVVMPATRLAELYGQYGARLLEQNVRSFLQARGGVNKGIRATIIHSPDMFFAYNNGITATARAVELEEGGVGYVITSLTDLQIVNGGQTTASLFQAQRKDRVSLDRIFVQMKLTIIDDEQTEDVVPRISEYANTQNRVNAADFFSNHPFHVRMEEFSRRLWAPASQGAQRETKWFYERARGQYANEQGKRMPAEAKRFQAEYPKSQMMTKTDIAKFDGVWDDNPIHVNAGAQKNFVHYAARIGREWEARSDQFNEEYFRRLVARAILFRETERLVSRQDWYNGGYRANVVAYTLALLAKVCEQRGQFFDFGRVWKQQRPTPATLDAISVIARVVYDDIMQGGGGISNISEWCKKEGCWTRLLTHVPALMRQLPDAFFNELVSSEDAKDTARYAVKTQKIFNGIEAQRRVLDIPAGDWAHILQEGRRLKLFTPKQIGVLEIAAQIPAKLPSEKQAFVLLEVLETARTEAIWSE